MDQKLKCILRQTTIIVITATITFVAGYYIVGSVTERMYSSIDSSAINESNLQTLYTYPMVTPYHGCFSTAPILYAIIGIIGIILGYYWFIKPCLVKEKTDNGDKT